MHLKLNFVIEFASDWHINAGYGEAGRADAVIEKDSFNRPIISGSTLKGIFRDALYDLKRNLGADHEQAKLFPNRMLGAPGIESRWRFEAANPTSSANLLDPVIAAGVRVDPRFRRAEDNKLFVRELGAAQKYQFTVSSIVAEQNALEDIEWLAAAASYIQRLGGRRRRGSGACRIYLDEKETPDLHKQVLRNFGIRQCGEMGEIDLYLIDRFTAPDTAMVIHSHTTPSHRYRIWLYTKRPLLIAQKPEAGNTFSGLSIIPGQALRGAFAARAQPDNDASNYEAFKQFFVLGDVKFSHLNPMMEQKSKDKPSQFYLTAEMPLGLQRMKDNEKDFTSVFQTLTEEKSFEKRLALNETKQSVNSKQLRPQVHPHIAINPLWKRAEDGNLYTYETIPDGRYFVGELYLKADDWEKLGQIIHVNPGEAFELFIGKGRNRSYGECRVLIEPIEENTPPTWIHASLKNRLGATEKSDELYITLASDTIVQNEWGQFYGRFDKKWLAEWLKTDQFEIQSADGEGHENPRPDQVVRTKLVESFDTRSGLPRWRDQALVAGSTARLVFSKGAKPNLETLKELEAKGIGMRRGEGYGRVVFNHPAHTGWHGFDGAVTIPEQLAAAQPKLSRNERFKEAWQDLINNGVLKQSKLVREWESHESVRRTLARQLMELNGQAPLEVLNTLQQCAAEAGSQENKQAAKQYQTAVETVAPLLQKLVDDNVPVIFSRRGLVLLAERLMQNSGENHAG